MKLIIRSAFALVFLIGLATPLLAQNPDVAVRIRPPVGNCFSVELKNLRNAPVVILTADIFVFDRNCQRRCASRIVLNKRITGCRGLTFRMCCNVPPPPGYVCYVRVHHSEGTNEGWLSAVPWPPTLP